MLPSLSFHDVAGLLSSELSCHPFSDCFAGSASSPQTPGAAEPTAQTLAFLFAVQMTSCRTVVSHTVSLLLTPRYYLLPDLLPDLQV